MLGFSTASCKGQLCYQNPLVNRVGVVPERMLLDHQQEKEPTPHLAAQFPEVEEEGASKKGNLRALKRRSKLTHIIHNIHQNSSRVTEIKPIN